MKLWHEGECPPPPWGLVRAGPLVEVTIGHPDDYLYVDAEPPQSFATRKMMIDTGAAFTLIEEDLPAAQNLRPIRFREVIGVDQRAAMRPVFRMSLGLEVGDDRGHHTVVTFREDVVGMPPPETPEEYVGLLGRDFLRHFRFVYDGPTARFQLIYERRA